MNIILTSVHIRKSPDALPLAPALLKSYVNSNSKKYNIKIKEFYLKDSIKNVAGLLCSSKPRIIGFSVYLWNRDFYMKLAKEVKKIDNRVIIVAGGAETRSSFESMLQSGIDYTLQGEGEEVFLEFLNAVSKGKNPVSIKGVNDSFNRFVNDINLIPSPLINRSYNFGGQDGFLWELSRGCPFSCDFCFESRGSKGVRYYNLERVKEELDIITKLKIPQVFVLDPTFNKDLPRAKKILRLIKKKKSLTHFHFEVRAEFIDEELADLFASIGASIQIGIQSGSDKVLRNVNRKLNRELFTKKMNILNRYGVIFGLDLIYGLPGDNYKGFKDSMEYVLSQQPNHVDTFPLAVLPGTALKDNANKLGLKYLQTPPYTVVNSPSYSEKDMEMSEKLKKACDYIYNRGKSTGWLSQVTKELKTSNSDFIEKFSLWVDGAELCKNGKEVITIKSFIKDNYRSKFLDLIFDIINYHSSYSKALLLKKRTTSIDQSKLIKSIPSFPETTTLIDFNYNVLDAFDNGLYTIEEIKRIYGREKGKYVTWYHSYGEVMSDCYDNKIMDFLGAIDGKKRSCDIAPNIDTEFLKFAQDSGMLLFR